MRNGPAFHGLSEGFSARVIERTEQAAMKSMIKPWIGLAFTANGWLIGWNLYTRAVYTNMDWTVHGSEQISVTTSGLSQFRDRISCIL